MKKYFIIFLCFCLVFSGLGGLASAQPAVSAQSCILIHAGTGEVLYEHNADARMLIASTTKIMTATVVLENAELTDEVEIAPEWAGIEGSSMYIKAGETYTVEELLSGMMIVSGNDAAVALACHVAGSVEDFAVLMNEKAEQLEMTDSAFVNPNGLDAEGHYSTARDMARLTAYCMQNEAFRAVVSTKSRTIGENTYINHNKLLWSCEGCIGVKTGYTMASGRSLISACEREGARFICVTLGDPDDWRDHAALYDWAYGQYGYRTVIDSCYRAWVPVIAGEETSVTVSPQREVKVFLPKAAEVTIEVELPRFVFAGFAAGDEAGCIRALCEGEELACVPLIFRGDGQSDYTATALWERLGPLGALGAQPYYKI